MGTGLIYAAIVAAWAAYLVPLWLRRQDELVASRREGQAIGARVLERRTRPDGTGVVWSAPRSAEGSDEYGNEAGTDAGDTVGEDAEVEVTRPVADRASSSGPTAAARRRRTLFVLLLAATVVATLAATAGVSWWWVAIPAGSIVLFLVSSIMAVRRTRNFRAETWEDEPLDDDIADDVYGDAGAGYDGVSGPDHESGQRGVEPGDGGNGDSWRGADGLWDPIPVPLPTYVTKAKAPRTVRTIDLADSEVQSSGRLPEAGMLDRPADSPDDVVEATESPADTHADAGSAGSGAPFEQAGTEPDHRRAVGD